TANGTEPSTDCAIIPAKNAPLVIDGKLHLGMSRLEVVRALGPPSEAEAAQVVYSHNGKLADGFEETAWLILRFREEKLVSMRGLKTMTNGRAGEAAADLTQGDEQPGSKFDVCGCD